MLEFNIEKYVRFGVHEIWLRRQSSSTAWHITVTSPVLGAFYYEGWWQGSQGRPWQAALQEAKHVAALNKLEWAPPAKTVN
jgi:hypothetical protein